MAVRPVFIPSIRRGSLFEEAPVDFEFFTGFAPSQKARSIASMHLAAAKLGITPLLEVSTKSPLELGRRLSAFNLKIDVSGELFPLESVYQSSKVFSISGQHSFLMRESPYAAKKLIRELGRGEVIAFRVFDRDFPTFPKNAFYDWLYIRAIQPHHAWVEKNIDFYGYTDIEFNPGRSVNCQARAVAEYMSLLIKGSSQDCYEDFDAFRELLLMAQRHDM